jgi:hypothetical protein
MTNKKYTPHKHAEVIKAWAEGKPIQMQGEQGTWVDLDNVQLLWLSRSIYRVKPEEVVDFTIVDSRGALGGSFANTIVELRNWYDISFPTRQGILKRTKVDGKVIAMEFISKDNEDVLEV